MDESVILNGHLITPLIGWIIGILMFLITGLFSNGHLFNGYLSSTSFGSGLSESPELSPSYDIIPSPGSGFKRAFTPHVMRQHNTVSFNQHPIDLHPFGFSRSPTTYPGHHLGPCDCPNKQFRTLFVSNIHPWGVMSLSCGAELRRACLVK